MHIKGSIMKKHFYLFSSLLSISSGLLNAQQQSNRQSPQQSEAVTTQPRAMITPAVAPRVSDGAGLIFTADFIWWKTNISGMEYATSGVVDTGFVFVPLGQSTKKGRVAQPNFDFEPGFKIGAGLDFAYDGWDLYANYTWLNGDTERNSISARRGRGATTLIPIVDAFGFFIISNVIKARSEWRQHFNVVDLELGRNFFISRRLTLRPHFGLKSAWLSEKFVLRYANSESTFLGEQNRRQTLWGIGTRAGLNTVWHFSRNWGLYGDLAATALWSDFHVKTRDRETDVSLTISPRTLNTKQIITEVIPIFETGLGLTYMAWFNQDECLLQISAGWEQQVWLGYNHFIDFNRTGNLSVHGLTIKVGFAF
jgi:hypothetical protein